MKKELRIPSIIGVIILIVAVVAGVYLTNSKVTTSSNASGSCNPDSVQITNITHNSVSISFLTSAPCLSNINLNNQTYDDLHSDASRLHYFEIKHLSELTSYSFSVISGGQTLTKDSYRFKTAKTPAASIPTSNLAWGKVFAGDQKTPGVAIVYLNIPGASPLSSVVTTNGNWSASLANSFNESLDNWFLSPASPVDEDLIVISEDGVTTQVTNTTANNNPVPDIIIGKNSLSSPVISSPPKTGQLDAITPVQTKTKIDILNPKNGDVLKTTQPDFFGSAPINSTVVVEVHSDIAQNGTVVSDTTGSWHWTPPSGLSPGEHTITVKVQNTATGVWDTVTRNFTVLASDNSGPQYVASGSATLAPSTPTPTMIVPTVTPIPTVRVARPSVTVKPPVTGNTAPTVIIIFASLIFFLISVKFIK